MNIKAELAAMERLTTGELVERYAELTGQPVRTRHRAYLIRKIAWRLQANAEGDLPSRAVAASAGVGLSDRARRRAMELASDAEVRLMPPRRDLQAEATARAGTAPIASARDPRLPVPSTAITRNYKGRTFQVVVLADGFEFEGNRYRTLSAVAKEITGSHWNGFRSFRLGAGQ